jgi:hypothetical protein
VKVDSPSKATDPEASKPPLGPLAAAAGKRMSN